MPLVENPVRCHGLSVLDNTTGVILKNGGVIVLLSPAFPDTMVNEIYEILIKRDTHSSPSSSIWAEIFMSLMLQVSSNLALSTTALNLTHVHGK